MPNGGRAHQGKVTAKRKWRQTGRIWAGSSHLIRDGVRAVELQQDVRFIYVLDAEYDVLRVLFSDTDSLATAEALAKCISELGHGINLFAEILFIL
jgi:hypothetical protein